MGPGPDGEFREVRENVRKYVKGPIQWIKTTKEVPSPIKSTPVRIDSSTRSSAEPPTSQPNIPQPISLNAPGPSSKASRPPKKASTSVRLAERKIHQRGAFSSDSEDCEEADKQSNRAKKSSTSVAPAENPNLDPNFDDQLQSGPRDRESISERPRKAPRKKKKIITAKKKSSIVMSDSVSDQIPSTEMQNFELPPIEVTKESPKRRSSLSKKKKDRSSRKRVADDPIAAMKIPQWKPRKKPIIINPRIQARREALTMAEGMPIPEDPALKSLTRKPSIPEVINRLSPKTSDFETPEPSTEVARPSEWNPSFNTRVTQASGGSSAHSFDLFHFSPSEEEKNSTKSKDSKKKAVSDEDFRSLMTKKPKVDHGLPDFSDNTPEPSQDTVPYQPVVSSAPQRKSKTKVDFTDSDSENSRPPSPNLDFRSKRSSKEWIHCISSGELPVD